MNRSKLKNYAPQARREFIQAVTSRAAFYGLTKSESQLVTVQGDVALIGGRAFPRGVAEKRQQLEERIKRNGFEPVMEAVAYTWFNRLVAIRYMELHGYLDHGYRVLSHPEAKATPEIVEHAEHVDFTGLDKKRVIDLKLDGTKESELFRILLIAQCNALHSAMPFLFERIDDETELLLPDNLLHSDSIVRKLVSEIDEADWQQVEIIGWLYQFYISDKKDEVIGKVVKSEDIPAATQLFTPNWIVKYLVQNSLGRQWLATYPDSPLKTKWEYYIEAAEQTPEVQAKLREITPATLNPEELTIMDPACGSGHILVEAYDLLKDIYLERGYRLRDIPRLILTKNVYGLEIDDRAAQLSCFALLMKAREDDRTIFDPPPQLNVLAIQESNSLSVNTIVQAFTEKRITKDDDLPSGEFGFMTAERAPLFAGGDKTTQMKADEQVASDLKVLLALFENAKTYGSLIIIPLRLAQRLPVLIRAVEAAKSDENLAVQNAANVTMRFTMAANLLAKQYDAVVTNPPYMGRKGMNSLLKQFAKNHYPNCEADIFAMFIRRCQDATKHGGFTGMVIVHSWMFLPSFEQLRFDILDSTTIINLAHLASTVMGIAFGASATVWQIAPNSAYAGLYTHVALSDLNDDGSPPLKLSGLRRHACKQNIFTDVPSRPIAYWMSEAFRRVFKSARTLDEIASPRQGLSTTDNDTFLRFWFEVACSRINFSAKDSNDAAHSDMKWFPYSKGGAFRKWYGNNEYVINWEANGRDVKEYIKDKNPNVARGESNYFREAVTWSLTSNSNEGFAARWRPLGFIFDINGMSAFPKSPLYILALLNSRFAVESLKVLNPTMAFQVGDIKQIPAADVIDQKRCERIAARCVEVAKYDWDSQETSWDYRRDALLMTGINASLVKNAYSAYEQWTKDRIVETKELEEENNRLILASLGLHTEMESAVAEDLITLRIPSLISAIRNVASFAIGCAMGRYSLDEPGLIYANNGNEGFDQRQYQTFPADPDGIIPATEFDWFPDSAARRFEEFVGVAWPTEHLQENLQFVADSLTGKSGADSRETIRSYFADDFYKHHLQTYKKRPIYWLFSSGKQRAFQALIYLHRYHEGTLARMRTEYVIPLQGKIASRISQLEGDAAKATASAHRKKLDKERDALIKQQHELREFDEKLRHYADQRIKLDLDDGVKVNYSKFSDLLAEVKAVCGKDDDGD